MNAIRKYLELFIYSMNPFVSLPNLVRLSLEKGIQPDKFWFKTIHKLGLPATKGHKICIIIVLPTDIGGSYFY
jgi:hypothetical protein